jgi:cellulose synthase/poly-beta-1,6-N-acetylglucosamine synthase-like glycosyltransferase
MIIDNAGDAETTENICKSYPSLPTVYHHFPINSGAKARNRWIEHIASDTDIVVCIDDDTTFWPEFLSEIESFFIDNPRGKMRCRTYRITSEDNLII